MSEPIYHQNLPAWVRESIPDFFSGLVHEYYGQQLPADMQNVLTRVFEALRWPPIVSPPTSQNRSLGWESGPFIFEIRFKVNGGASIGLLKEHRGATIAEWGRNFEYKYGHLLLGQVRRAWLAIAQDDLDALETLYADYEAVHDAHREFREGNRMMQ